MGESGVVLESVSLYILSLVFATTTDKRTTLNGLTVLFLFKNFTAERDHTF